MSSGPPPLVQVHPPHGACALTARELAMDMREGRRDPRDVMEEFLVRAHVVQGEINAFTYLFADEARQMAAESAQRIAEGRARRLEGVPFAVKELTPVEGQPHTLGSVALKDNVGAHTDPGVQALIDAGAIPFARTNTPEFGCASITDNLLFGETLNPWNTAFGTAGSSGGAAAALASFATPLAQGTDSAGSLRMPAAACGVVGFKPSHGVVPMAAPDYLDTFGHSGPMARTVDDVALMFDVMAQPDPSRLMVRHLATPAEPSELRDLRVACVTSIDGLTTDPDVEAGVRLATSLLESAGAHVREVPFPWTWDRLYRTVILSFAAVYMAQAKRLQDAGAPLSDLTEGFIKDVEPVISDYGYAVDARAEMAQLQQDLGAIFSEHDVIAMPTLQIPAPVAGEHFLHTGPLVNGEPSADRWIVAFTVPFNLASACPAITLPAGWSTDGIPTAVQLIGHPYRDLDLLRWAGQLENLLIDSNHREGVRRAGE